MNSPGAACSVLAGGTARGAVVVGLRAVHLQRWDPDAVRPCFLIGSRRTGQVPALTDRASRATRSAEDVKHRPGSTADTMKNPTSPHHHNGKPELEQHIHTYNPLLNQGRPILLPEGRSETDSTSGSHRCLTGRRRS